MTSGQWQLYVPPSVKPYAVDDAKTNEVIERHNAADPFPLAYFR